MLIFSAFAAMCLAGSEAIAMPYEHPMAVTKKGIVLSCQPLAAQMGIDVLRKGGNAADAFIAATLGEYVTAYGYTSLSGPLNILYYEAASGGTSYLNAGINKVGDPNAQFNSASPVAGQSFVVGGAGRGLEALFRRFGGGNHLKFSEVTAPAEATARKGFVISREYGWTIKNRAPLFANSQAWNAIYRKNGKLLISGDTFVQPALADTLAHLGAEGADYLYKGAFAHDLVAGVQAYGGGLTLADLANYQISWSAPLSTTYRDFVVLSGSYRSIGGLELFLGLKAIESFQRLGSGPHFSKDPDVFDKVFRTYLFAAWQAFSHWPFSKRLDDLASLQAELAGTLSDPSPSALWDKVMNPNIPLPWTKSAGHHSCDPVVIDREGNIAVGNHTIYSMPWGDYGMIVDGVSLNTAYPVAYDSPPGERSIDVVVPTLIMKQGKPFAAAGFFDSSLQAGAFQVMLNLMDYGMRPDQALLAPRFGSPSIYNPFTVPLDPRYPAAWVKNYVGQGVNLAQPPHLNDYVDTGDAMVIQIDPTSGFRYGAASEVLPEAVALTE